MKLGLKMPCTSLGLLVLPWMVSKDCTWLNLAKLVCVPTMNIRGILRVFKMFRIEAASFVLLGRLCNTTKSKSATFTFRSLA